MFTGIITTIGTIESQDMRGDLRIAIACGWKDFVIGESIAVSGACLTVVATFPLPLREGVRGRGEARTTLSIEQESPPTLPSPSRGEGSMFSVDISGETIARTAPGMWEKGRKLNLERALKMGDSLDGHLVTGHVDGVTTLVDMKPDGDSHILCFEAPTELSRFIAEKGSVTLDGVSLTVNKVDGAKFRVNIIPHTWQNTTLGLLQPGHTVNLEIDLIARYVARLMATS